MKSLIKFMFPNQYVVKLLLAGIIPGILITGFKSKSFSKSLDIKPFALVELFTSEGCSSCPPADKLLTEVVNQAEENKLNLFALSFHVNYWDYLGWKDSFANESYTNRQKRYAKKLGSGVYTPQMIINGNTEFVGSNKKIASEAINIALGNSESIIKFGKLNFQKDRFKVYFEFEVIGDINNKLVNIAIVERDLNVDVKRGENHGKKLHHDNVVKHFKSLSISKIGSITSEISIPEKINMEKSSVIIYLQDLYTLQIFDAYGTPF